MTRGEKYGVSALAGFSAVVLAAAAYERIDADRPYRNIPHFRIETVALDARTARRADAIASQSACNAASTRLLGELEQDRIIYADGNMEEDSFQAARASILSDLRLACEGAELVPAAIYEPEVIEVTPPRGE